MSSFNLSQKNYVFANLRKQLGAEIAALQAEISKLRNLITKTRNLIAKYGISKDKIAACKETWEEGAKTYARVEENVCRADCFEGISAEALPITMDHATARMDSNTSHMEAVSRHIGSQIEKLNQYIEDLNEKIRELNQQIDDLRAKMQALS